MQGKYILGYTLTEKIGKGGMAEVWRAQNQLGQNFAVKFLLSEFCTNENVVARFRNEAMVMARLSHPNIRKVYNFDVFEGRPYMIMEYLEGEDLQHKAFKNRVSEADLKKWWNQMVDALNHTHAQYIIHRDIKPSNIFITSEGDVKLLDFGIAKNEDNESHTTTGAVMGTVMYMSPEQIRCTKGVDYRTDIYSLAQTFAAVAAGRPPYDTSTLSDFDVREKIVREPADLSRVPEAWKNFLKPYLAKEPTARPALAHFSAAAAPLAPELLVGTIIETDNLQSGTTDLPFVTPEPEKKEKTSKKKEGKAGGKKSHKKLIIWLTAGILALGGGFSAYWFVLKDKKTMMSEDMWFDEVPEILYGKVKSIEWTEEDEEGTIYLDFDKSTKLTGGRYREFDRDGVLHKDYTILCNEHGDIISEKVKAYYYDDEGTLIEEEEDDRDRSDCYTYNSDGLKIEWRHYDDNHEVDEKHVYEYNSDKQLTSKIWYYRDGEYGPLEKSHGEYYFYDSKGNITSIEGKSMEVVEWGYDEYSEESYPEETEWKLYGTTYFTYDDYGHVTREIEERVGSDYKDETQYEYEYDSHKNWTVRRVYRVDENGDRELQRIERRTITYYNKLSCIFK